MSNAQAAPALAKIAAAAESIPDLSRHIITYDRDDPSTYSPQTLPPAAIMGAETRSPIPWPQGCAPTPEPLANKPSSSAALPKCDYVIVTWTVEEARCLADTLTPGFPSKTSWYLYDHLFESQYAADIRHGAPASMSKRLGSYFLTSIAGKKALCMKSELHMSQDGPKLPVAKLWKQIITETECKLIITRHRGRNRREDGAGRCRRRLRRALRLPEVVQEFAVPQQRLQDLGAEAHVLHRSREALCGQYGAPAAIVASAADLHQTGGRRQAARCRHHGLLRLRRQLEYLRTAKFGRAVEMGDAVLGMVINDMGAKAPKWAAIRNASDPQINDTGLTLKEAADKAGQIYEKFGYWTTIPSAIACWATVRDN